MAGTTKRFFWYELMTTDVPAAVSFYADVVGWRGEAFGGMAYMVMSIGDRGVAGVMELPDALRSEGVPPCWTGYIYAEDTDAATDSVVRAGGSIQRAPWDVPGVGRMAVVADPQGAVFMLMTPIGEDRPPLPMMTPGQIGWHELYADDREAALAFYAGQFGWEKGDVFDMGEMGKYQIFNADGEPRGGMMNRPPEMPAPAWLFYFTVSGIDAAVERVTKGGGTVLFGPMEVPGGGWVAQARDPQGAYFALVSESR